MKTIGLVRFLFFFFFNLDLDLILSRYFLAF